MSQKLIKYLLVLLLSVSPILVFAQESLLEYHPQGGYVLLTPQGVGSQNVPKAFLDKIKQLKNRKSDIKSMAFTPDGKGWTIITGDSGISDNV